MTIRPLLTCVLLLSAYSQGEAAVQVALDVRDLTPKFLSFYQAASTQHADEAKRWELWKELYDFAAVPPTPEGERMARKMLDDSWPRYPSILKKARQGQAAIQPPPQAILQSVATLLQADLPVRARLVIFVGSFDNNAFTAPGKDGVPTVAAPVEGEGLDRLLTHEFTHVVEAEQAHLSLDWQRSIAHTIFAEGLAMRATQKSYPGLAPREYVGEFSPNWFERAQSLRLKILDDIAPHLAENSSDAVMRYTMGQGGAGIDREAYFAGWLVVGDLLDHGWTFPRLARVPEERMVEVVSESLKRLRDSR